MFSFSKKLFTYWFTHAIHKGKKSKNIWHTVWLHKKFPDVWRLRSSLFLPQCRSLREVKLKTKRQANTIFKKDFFSFVHLFWNKHWHNIENVLHWYIYLCYKKTKCYELMGPFLWKIILTVKKVLFLLIIFFTFLHKQIKTK